MVNVMVTDIENVLDRQLQGMVEMVSRGRPEKIRRYRHKSRFLQSMAGYSLLRHYIDVNLKKPEFDIDFAYGDYGKPAIRDMPGVHFNISHSINRVVCAVGEETVGVDIEYISEPRLCAAKTYFSASEYEILLGKSGLAQSNYFYELWTMKESYIKWLGEGLRALKSACFADTESGFRLKADASVRCFLIDTVADYKMSVCTRSKIFSLDFVSISDIL